MSDKPGHVFEIPESLGRDVDAFYEGKRPAPPIEAFMSDAALDQVAAQTAAASAPVYAEDLVPITKAEAARRTTFDGEHLPKMPATRRVIPPPFRRERISLDRHGRTWTTCPAEDVKAGDVVVDIGRVDRDAELVTRYETVAGIPDVAVAMKVIITGISGNRVPFTPGTRVRAFRLAELWPGRVFGAWTSAAGSASPPTATSTPASP
jgi:hypothetical protein